MVCFSFLHYTSLCISCDKNLGEFLMLCFVLWTLCCTFLSIKIYVCTWVDLLFVNSLDAVIHDWLEPTSPPFLWGPQPKWADGGMVNIVGTKENWKISSFKSLPPKLKRKKYKAHSKCAWAFPFAAWNFSSQKNLSPFLASQSEWMMRWST